MLSSQDPRGNHPSAHMFAMSRQAACCCWSGQVRSGWRTYTHTGHMQVAEGEDFLAVEVVTDLADSSCDPWAQGGLLLRVTRPKVNYLCWPGIRAATWLECKYC
jgi:hypothetical protein